MTDEAVAALRQQVAAVRAQVLAALMAVDALAATLPAPKPEESKSTLTWMGKDEDERQEE